LYRARDGPSPLVNQAFVNPSRGESVPGASFRVNAADNSMPRPTKAFASWNLFSALLLLPEQRSAVGVQKVLEDYGIAVNAASGVVDVAQMMRSRRLDLLIFDSDLPWAEQLACLGPATNWRGIAIAMSSLARRRASGVRRVHFTLSKPVTADLLVRALKAAYTNLAQQRIANYRHSIPARLVSGTLNHRGWQRTLHQVSVLNLSQTGLCLSAAEPLPHGASLSMSLTLPESAYSLHASGNIVWSHSNGRTGVAFDRSAGPDMKRFQERLNDWLPPELGMAAGLSR
jgi:PilZ domain-containing protein